MTRKERTAQLRSDPNIHYNCAQSVFIPFAEEMGLTTEQAIAIASNFGAGMRAGATCGSVTGALMALGLLGKGPEAGQAFWQEFKSRMGAMNCAELLQMSKQRGEEKKSHCDNLVFTAVELVEKYAEK